MSRQRIGKDIGLPLAKAWLADWYGEPFDLHIEHIRISVPSDLRRQGQHEWSGEACHKANQSPLHAYLKIIARRWLESTSDYPASIRYEAMCYTPDDDRLPDRHIVNFDGAILDLSQAKALSVGENFPCYFGDIICVDVWAQDTSVEVGFTRPFNLLTPFLDGLVEKAVWVPFPEGVTTQNFDPTMFTSTEVAAYIISQP